MAVFLTLSFSDVPGQAKADDGDNHPEDQEWRPVVEFNPVSPAGDRQGHEDADDGPRLNPVTVDADVPTGGRGDGRHEGGLPTVNMDRSLNAGWRGLLNLQRRLLQGTQTGIKCPLVQPVDADVLQPGAGLLEAEGDGNRLTLLVVG